MAISTQSIGKFWLKVLRGSIDECWPWNGPMNEKGTGITRVPGCKTKNAQRIAWTIMNGRGIEPPKDHPISCKEGTENCCNGAHLEVGTYVERARRAGRMELLTTDITVEQARELSRQSVAQGRSKASIVREALERALNL